MSKKKFEFDVLVIGSGAAGLTLALKVADKAKVAVLSKAALDAGSTSWAQGGIAAVQHDKDTLESHIEDTMVAGAGLCHRDAVSYIVERGPKAINWLVEQGVDFTRRKNNGRDTFMEREFHLTQEGGHSHRRILHSADATGKEIQMSLEEQARAHPNISLFENHVAVDLVSDKDPDPESRKCVGAYILDTKRGMVDVFQSKMTVLATGGASRVYLYTSNPDGSTGDGIALAWRFGCRVANMEFNQFHPTCLYHSEARTFLLTEALRGEGAYLRLSNGERFMPRFDERAELAPRDIVARAIDHEMKRLGEECVYLDITHKDPEFVKSHFPTIYARCLKLGYDMTKQPIPVVPAAHYTCGGVMTDLHGRTDVNNLYAIGEVTHTGLHGANRMASNSLLECVVMAEAAAEDILSTVGGIDKTVPIKPWDESLVTDSDEEVVVTHNWNELRHFMWDYVGIVRTTRRLERAARRIDMLAGEIREYYSYFRVSSDLLELRNLVTVANLIIRSALQRTESRGLHYTLDYPETDPDLAGVDTILKPPRRPVMR